VLNDGLRLLLLQQQGFKEAMRAVRFNEETAEEEEGERSKGDILKRNSPAPARARKWQISSLVSAQARRGCGGVFSFPVCLVNT